MPITFAEFKSPIAAEIDGHPRMNLPYGVLVDAGRPLTGGGWLTCGVEHEALTAGRRTNWRIQRADHRLPASVCRRVQRSQPGYRRPSPRPGRNPNIARRAGDLPSTIPSALKVRLAGRRALLVRRPLHWRGRGRVYWVPPYRPPLTREVRADQRSSNGCGRDLGEGWARPGRHFAAPILPSHAAASV